MPQQANWVTSPSSSSLEEVASLLLKKIRSCAKVFMRATHSRKWLRWSACYGYRNEDPVIQQLYNEGMMSGTGFQFGDGNEIGRSGEVSVWKKNIIMGGKCQLPDFSGVIIYDSAGNAVTPAKQSARPLALTWK